MKKALLCLVCMLTVLIGKAQTPDTTTHYGLMNYVFSNVNKTSITTGILRDYGIEFADLSQYNGTALTDTNWVTLPDFKRVYNTLYSAQITTAANLLGLDSANTIISSYASTSKPITFACLNYNYNYLDSNAVVNHLFTVTNNQLFDVAGRTQSPYLQATAFAIAPTQQGILTGNNQLIFRPQLFFSNTGKTVSSIQIDPTGTGTYQTVAFNTAITVNYANTGMYTVNFIITYTDGTKRYAHTKFIAYQNPNSSGTTQSHALALGSSAYTGFGIQTLFTATKAYMGVKASGDYTIELSANNTSGLLKKPLIVIDGFDPDAATNYPYSGGTYNDLITNKYSKDPNDNGSAITLNSGLENTDSFDIVYLHWKNGTDYIERNAYLLETLIQKVNTMKATSGSTEKNVIIGMSMGGLVARWALRDMEMNSIDHQTRLFISHDAPNWGANVPVGYQAMVQYFASWQVINSVGLVPLHVTYKSMISEAQQGLDLFNSPAARQMLIQRYMLSGTVLTADNSLHTSFMTELNNMGWPQNSRNIILSNGTGNGTPLFADNSQMLKFSGQTNLGYGTQLGLSFVSSLFGVIGETGITGLIIPNVPINNTTLLIQFPLSIVSTKTALGINMGAWAVPKTGTGTLFNLDLYIKRKLLWTINSTSHIINSTIKSTSGMLPLDNAPGGTFQLSSFGVDVDAINIQLAASHLSFLQASLIQPAFCFVPTVSALNINNPGQNLFSVLNSNTVPCLLPLYVSDYHTAPQTNQEHISYTQDNTNWLMTELPVGYNNTAVCPSNYQVMGPTSTCSLSNTYSVANLPATGTVTWSVSPAGIVTLTPNADNTVTVNRTSTGNITLTAHITITGASPFSNTTNVLVGGCVVVKNSGSGVIRGGVTFVNSAGQQTSANFGGVLNSTTLVLLPGQYTLNVNLAPGSGPILIQENGSNHQVPAPTGGATFTISPLSVADGYALMGYSPYYTNVAQSRTFTRNNCSSGMLGTSVVYTVPAGTYFSAISQQDADGQATNDINTNGQTYSNVHGTCTTPSIVIQNNSDGRIMIQFIQGTTIVNSTILIAGASTTLTTIPSGSYTVKMQNAGTGSSHVFSLTGYTSQTGTTATFNAVNIGTSLINISITNAGSGASNSFVLYPNPANSLVTIQSAVSSKTPAALQTMQVNNTASTGSAEAAPAILKVNVYDKSGTVQLIQNYGKNTNKAQFDISKLVNGIYLVEITTAKGTEIYKLIITH